MVMDEQVWGDDTSQLADSSLGLHTLGDIFVGPHRTTSQVTTDRGTAVAHIGLS